MTITNSGTISSGDILAASGSTFQPTNNTCGKIITEAIYQNNGGTTTNAGLFQVGANLDNIGGTFTNNGILKYGSRTGNAVVSNANSSIIVNDTPTPIFTYGGTYNGTINGIYTDSGATTSAGTFTAPNTFVPTGLPTGSQTLYAKITPSGGACSYVVPFTYVAVNQPTVSNFTTVDNTVCAGSPISFTATVGNVSPPYAYTLTNGSSTTTGNSSTASFSQNLTASGSGVQTFTLTVNDGGSSSSATTNVTVNRLPTANSFPASIALTCNAPTVSLTATGTGTVRWSTGATTPIISVTTAGIYSFTLTDANGCQATDFSTVGTNNNQPGALLSASGALNCAVSSVTLTVETGTGLSFAFSSGASQIGGSSGRSATVTTPGIYSVTATGGNGCTSTSSVTVLSNVASPTARVSSVADQLDCNTTAITLTASGGVSYRWSDGQTTATRSVSIADTYSVTVTGANGCTAVASKTITSNTTPPTANILAPASTTLTCTTPTLALTATGGGTYRWDDASTNAIRTVNASGTYSVTVTNTTSGCFSVTSISISQDVNTPTATLSASPSTTLTCAQTSLTLTAGGGNAYAFSPTVVSQSGNTAVVNAAGVYSVTVTNTATGCASTTSITISQDASTPTATLSASPSTTLTCAQTSLTLTAVGGNAYTFSPTVVSQSGNTAVVNAVGVYSVTVTNTATGCASTTSITISQDASTPVATLSASPSTTLTCAQTSLTLTAGGGSSYAFSPNVTSQSGNTAVVNAAGVYSVTVTNTTSGCFSVTSITISRDASTPVATLSASPSTTLTCAQTSLTLTAGGGNAYAFSPTVVSQSSSTAVVNAAGVYSVTVTNTATGCASTTSITISRDASTPVATLSASPSTTLTCAQTSLTLTAGGGSSYAFSPTVVSQSGNTAVVNAAGVYSVTVTNMTTGCASVTNITISQDASTPVATLSASPSTTLTCAQTSLTLTAGGGNTYAFSPTVVSQSGNTAVVNAAGVYSVTVTNTATGCTSTTSLTISQDASTPTATLSASPSTTLTCAQTSLTLTAGGGNAYTFSPNVTSQSGNTAVVNAAGVYSVTVTNTTTGCATTTSITISRDASTPVATLSASPSTTLTCAQTSLTLTAGGGSSYAFSPNVASQSGNMAVINAAGVYSVTVTNTATGCASVTMTTIISNTANVVVTNPPVATTTQGQPFSQPFIPSGGVIPYSFSVASGTLPNGLTLTNDGVVSGIPTQTGSFSITVRATDANGCSATGPLYSFIVSPAPIISGELRLIQPSYDCQSGAITFQTQGGNGSQVEFRAIGVTDWTTNPNQTLDLSVRQDPNSQPITLQARQNGIVTIYTFDFRLFCSGTGGNQPPVFTQPPTQTATIGQAFSYRLPDETFRGTNGTAVNFVVSGLPDGLTYSTLTRILSGIPTTVGTNTLTLTVSDPLSQSASGTLTIVVNPAPVVQPPVSGTVNVAPVFNGPLTTQFGTIGVGFGYALPGGIFTDANGDALILSAQGLPTGLSFNPTTGLISGTPTTAATTSVTLTATDQGNLSASGLLTLVISNSATLPPTGSQPLMVLQPLYDCQTGAITFQTQGGDGSPIFFSAIGVVASSTVTSYTLEAAIRNDANSQPLLIKATQGNVVASFVFDFRLFYTGATTTPPPVFVGPIGPVSGTVGSGLTYQIPGNAFTSPSGAALNYTVTGLPAGLGFTPATRIVSGIPTTTGSFTATVTASDPFNQSAQGPLVFTIAPAPVVQPPVSTSALTLLAPLYNCQTGAFTFRSSGGDGVSPIEYFAVGITGLTTMAGPYTVLPASDAQPFTLKARQNGVEVSYTWDFKAVCSLNGRQGAEVPAPWSASVLGNPVSTEVVVFLSGAQGQSLMVQVLNGTGRLVSQRIVMPVSADYREVFDISAESAGMLLLEVIGGGHRQVIKFIKQ